MKLSAIANRVSDKASKYAKEAKTTFNNTVKPFLGEQVKRVKTLSKDTVEFAKCNPKKVGKYALATLLAASAGAFIVKAVKDFVAAKKQNIILAKAFLNERENNKDLKDFIGNQQVIIESKDAVIEAQKKVIDEQKAKIAEN